MPPHEGNGSIYIKYQDASELLEACRFLGGPYGKRIGTSEILGEGKIRITPISRERRDIEEIKSLIRNRGFLILEP